MAAPLTGWYLFFLGLATGIVVLDVTVYRKLPSRWLRWTLIGLAAFVASRYLTMVLFALSDDPQRWWALRRCWLATSVGLTLPSVLVLDQLLRHPSWSATKVLRYFSPFLAVYLAIILCGRFELTQHALGWRPALVGGWRALLAFTQAVFVIGYFTLCIVIVLRMRSRRVRVAIGGLLLGHLAVTLAHVPVVAQHAGPFGFVLAETATLAALGHAFDTALQRAV